MAMARARVSDPSDGDMGNAMGNGDPSKSDMGSAMGDRSMGYEDARAALADVVSALESGDATLEEALALWERGEEYARICEAWLEGAQERLSREALRSEEEAITQQETSPDPE